MLSLCLPRSERNVHTQCRPGQLKLAEARTVPEGSGRLGLSSRQRGEDQEDETASYTGRLGAQAGL